MNTLPKQITAIYNMNKPYHMFNKSQTSRNKF